MNPAIALHAVIPNETMPANLPIPLESGHTNGPPESPCKNVKSTVNNYMQVTGIATGENFAFFIYRQFVETL